MNFDYNEEQQLLADSVRRFLQKNYGFEARKKIVGSAPGLSDAVWAQMVLCELQGQLDQVRNARGVRDFDA